MKKANILFFLIISLALIFYTSCLTSSKNNTDPGGLSELGPGSSTGEGGSGGGGDGGSGDGDVSGSDLINPHANWFNQFQPILEEFEGDMGCETPVDCWQSLQNQEPDILDSEDSWCTKGPICPYDPAGEIIPREEKTTQVTLTLCMTSEEALIIDNHGILRFIHFSDGSGKLSHNIVGEDLGESRYLHFHEYFNVGFCSGDPLHGKIDINRSDRDTQNTWRMPAILNYDLGLNVDSTCSIVIESVAAKPFENGANCALNMGYVPTWTIFLVNPIRQIPSIYENQQQYIVGELAFTIKYMERLELDEAL